VPAVTINDVAAEAGVSIKTVSRVMNNEPNVHSETRERVRAAAKALAYRPNISARSLAGSRSYLLGLFFDNPSSAYVTNVQLGAVARCRAGGYHLMIEPFDSAAEDIAAMVEPLMSTLRVDGVILTPPLSDNLKVLEILAGGRTPFVRIAPDRDRERWPAVGMDDERAAYEMAGHFLSLGHRDIAFIKGHPEHGASHLRFAGFVRAMREAGVPVPDASVRQGFFSFRSGFEAAVEFFSAPRRPTAVFASNDDMALGVMAAAHRQGLNVPQDISIAGFDDTPTASVVWPQLTTVRQPIFEMAEAAADMIISGQARLQPDGEAPTLRLLDFTLALRESTSPPT
jgi:LacI family transcriptional regulator